jgi:hypothetical protein
MVKLTNMERNRVKLKRTTLEDVKSVTAGEAKIYQKVQDKTLETRTPEKKIPSHKNCIFLHLKLWAYSTRN